MRPLDPVTVPLSGRVLVEASAGTGKTYTIATLFARLVVEAGLEAPEILVVTYTNAAAAELRDRVRKRLVQALRAVLDQGSDDPVLARLVEGWDPTAARARLEGAIRDFDLAEISTIHGFCRRVLQDRAFESGARFDTELSGESRPAVDTVAQDLWTTLLHDADPELVLGLLEGDDEQPRVDPKRLRGLVEQAVRPTRPRFLPVAAPPFDAADPDARAQLVPLSLEIVRRAPAALEAVRGEELRFFDDLLTELRDALRDPRAGARLAAAIREDLPAALIDEFQDTDPVQYEIFDRIYAADDARLFLIGDPKQAIYAFRGADLVTYLRARDDVGDQVYGLDVNWRSDKPLVDGINYLFGRVERPFLDPGIAYEPVGAAHPSSRIRYRGKPVPPVRVRFVAFEEGDRRQPGARHVAAAVVEDLVKLLSSPTELERAPGVWTRVEPGDVAVLVASHWQAADLQGLLVAAGVPAVRFGRTRVFDSDEARDLLALLDAVLAPHDATLLRTALATPLFEEDGADLAALLRDARRLADRLERFRAWRHTWEAGGVMRLVQEVFRAEGVVERVLARPGGERVMTNLRHLAELLHGAEHRDRLTPVGLVRWLRRERTESREDREGEAELRLESDSRAVQIVTMHASKGLEYPVVFCPFLWTEPHADALPHFHDPDDDTPCVDVGSAHLAEHADLSREEQAAERLRLAYVALTRAKHLCSISWGRLRTRHPSAWAHGPLAWLLHGDLAPWRRHAEAITRALGDDRRMFQALTQVAAGSEGRVAVHHVAARWEPTARWRPPASTVALGAVRGPAPTWPVLDLRIGSFSALVASESGEGAHDHDAVDAAPVEEPLGAVVVPLATFPRGAQAGTCVHALLEHLDFQRRDEPWVEALLRDTLARYGIDPARWIAPLRVALDDVCETPLGPEGVRLAALSRADRLDELGFHMTAGSEARPLSPAALADAFAAHAEPSLARDYAPRLRRLGFEAMHGFLKGYVDLVFRHDGRWYVVDYKTNHLGEHLDDYAPAAVRRAMLDGHYVLQYHLYLVALHRYLRLRLPGYDYDRDVGGVRYLFLRGMSPAAGPTRGVFADRPPRALVDALDALLDGAAA